MIESLFDGHFPRLWGRRLPRSKYQRPSVYATGKREKLWKAEWREYYIGANGKECSRHKSKTWARSRFTKAQAQAALDALIRGEQQGGPKRDGSMALGAFWGEVYYPVRAGKWSLNTRNQVRYLWRDYIEPVLGTRPLKEIAKADIDLYLLKLASEDKGHDLVDGVRKWLRSVLEEAVDNELIVRNPASKVSTPKCKPKPEARTLTVDEVQRLWDKTAGRDYLIWRVLVLTGIRIGEALALTRADLLPQGLLIDESALNGRAAATKNRKTRLVPLPVSLHAELSEWMASHDRNLIFQAPSGRMHGRSDPHMRDVLKRAREAAEIPDLKFKMCRTTLASLLEADIADTQAILGHHSAAFTLQNYKKAIPLRGQQSVEDLDARLKVVPIKRQA